MFNILKVVIPSQIFFLPYIANAQIIGNIVTCDITTCNICDLLNVLQNIANFFILNLLPFAIVAAVAWSGINYVYNVSVGDVSNVTFFSSRIKNILVGMLIILSSWLIINTFFAAVGYVGDWSLIECAEDNEKKSAQKFTDNVIEPVARPVSNLFDSIVETVGEIGKAIVEAVEKTAGEVAKTFKNATGFGDGPRNQEIDQGSQNFGAGS